MNRTSTADRFRFRMLVVLVAGTVMLSGCQGDPDEEQTTSPPTSVAPTSAAVSEAPTASAAPSGGQATAAPEPTPASSNGPAANIPVPTKPALADENSKEGLEAFTRYWFELFNYGYATNDWKAFDKVTDPACDTCTNVRNEVAARYEGGGWIIGGRVIVNSFSTEFQPNVYGSINSFVEIEQDALNYADSQGKTDGTTQPLPPTVNSLVALHDDQGWVVLDFGSPEGS
ncbi:DUF6318 family protein [Arthrobacter zhaoguopingii]|uniref:DUF6318 family protein n=1 Tax=Arthrobacter zhaoguopingii TaxID=2681491 RepID=UPI001358FCB5|nr:DUF6318 family protein [Arthrobacter zhaoguopingii]